MKGVSVKQILAVYVSSAVQAPLAADGWTLAHPDPGVRRFWVDHGAACRRVAAYLGAIAAGFERGDGLLDRSEGAGPGKGTGRIEDRQRRGVDGETPDQDGAGAEIRAASRNALKSFSVPYDGLTST